LKQSRGGWDELSDWWDRKQGDQGDLWHSTLIDPALLKVMGDCRGKAVLDLGCGNGYLARRLARRGAKVTALDASPRMDKNAKARDDGAGVTYVCSDANRMRGVSTAKFDLVFANMSLMDMVRPERAVAEVARVLKKRGRFVFSINHPCFDVMSNSSWVAESTLGGPPTISRRVRGYRKPFSEEVPWNLGDGSREYTTGYHRPLNWYARTLSANGLAITALEEPEPSREFIEKEQEKPGDLDGLGFLEVPLHLVFEAVKL
jgi:SAM-dependent methyltransferase